MPRPPLLILAGLLCVFSVLSLSGCPRENPEQAVSPAPAAHPAADPASTGLPAKTLAVVLGATEADEWTAAVLAVLASELDIEPLTDATVREGLDVFGPHECVIAGRPVTLRLAICDLGSVADLPTQQKLGELAQGWIEEVKPDTVWLDGDQLQLHCGSALDTKLPIVFTGVAVRPDAYYPEGRAVCGLLRQHSLARAVGELLREFPKAKTVALVSDDSALGLSRIAEVRALEAAMPYGMTFVTQEPVMSWGELRELLGGLDAGIDGVFVMALSGSGSAMARAGQSVPPGLLKQVEQPVYVYGPSPVDGSGVVSLRIKPAAHARLALELCADVLAGKGAAGLGITIPDEMDVYRSER